MDVSSRQWWWVEGHSHRGSHSGKTLGQGGGHAPPEPASLWSCRAQGLWTLLVYLYHLKEIPVPSQALRPCGVSVTGMADFTEQDFKACQTQPLLWVLKG